MPPDVPATVKAGVVVGLAIEIIPPVKLNVVTVPVPLRAIAVQSGDVRLVTEILYVPPFATIGKMSVDSAALVEVKPDNTCARQSRPINVRNRRATHLVFIEQVVSVFVL
jgi:hypothetical protein